MNTEIKMEKQMKEQMGKEQDDQFFYLIEKYAPTGKFLVNELKKWLNTILLDVFWVVDSDYLTVIVKLKRRSISVRKNLDYGLIEHLKTEDRLAVYIKALVPDITRELGFDLFARLEKTDEES